MARKNNNANYKVVIGLPARNEEAGIYDALRSIREAIRYAKISAPIIVCLNGCTDKTGEVVKKFIRENKDVKCSIIRSRPGLVHAQGKIVELFPADIYAFPDADGTIGKDSLKLLLDEFKKNPKLIVAYAKTVSLLDGGRSIAKKIGLLYDSQKLLTPRRYIHGRFFATREWYIPKDREVLSRAHKNRRNRKLLKYCKNKILMSADDIFMSSYIVDKYGRNAIKQVDGAHCFAWPIASFSDWFNTYRRRNIETAKMTRWFPEYNYLWPYLNRHTNWQKWFRAPIGDRILWLIFLLMKAIFYLRLKMEFLLLLINFYEPPQQWKVTASTKKSIK